jgi:hypothetical protein
MNDQDHSLSLSDPDRSLVLSHFLTNFHILYNERIENSRLYETCCPETPRDRRSSGVSGNTSSINREFSILELYTGRLYHE